ncbi:MAG: hypothetical protein U1E30_04645 [Rhodoblastus sp.]
MSADAGCRARRAEVARATARPVRDRLGGDRLRADRRGRPQPLLVRLQFGPLIEVDELGARVAAGLVSVRRRTSFRLARHGSRTNTGRPSRSITCRPAGGRTVVEAPRAELASIRSRFKLQAMP